MGEGVPDPGPRPEEFAFPFAEANAALAAIDQAVTELLALIRVHEEAVIGARVDFEGETRRSFDRGFAELLAQVDGGVARLENQRDQLEGDIEQAHRLRDASLNAIADWNRTSSAAAD